MVLHKLLWNSKDQLDFLEVPYLLIVLLYTFLSPVVTMFLAIFPLSSYDYIKQLQAKETGKYFLQ